MGLREARINRIEPAAILRAEIGRRLHAGQQHRDAAPAQLGQDGVEVLGRDLGLDAAQSIIGAELDDRRVRLVLRRCAEAQASRARPPAVVSPETPALLTRTARPSAASARSSWAGRLAVTQGRTRQPDCRR